MRCVVNGEPLKSSSSVASTYSVLEEDEFTLSNSFVVDLHVGFSDVQLQWKKTGGSSSKWNIINSANFASTQSMSISVLADYKQLVYVHDKKDAYISESDMWVDLTDGLNFKTERASSVAISYSVSVQPQLGAIIRGQNQEYLSVRVVVDNVPYRDGSTVFGDIVLKYYIVLQLILILCLIRNKYLESICWEYFWKAFASITCRATSDKAAVATHWVDIQCMGVQSIFPYGLRKPQKSFCCRRKLCPCNKLVICARNFIS